MNAWDISASRMNFLKCGQKGLTYGGLVTIGAAFVALLMLWYAFGLIRISLAKRSSAQLQQAISQLNVEKETRMSSMQLLAKKPIGATAQEELLAIFTETPQWSLLLHETASRLPRQLKLTSIRSERHEASGERRLIFTGQSNGTRAITGFVSALKRSSLYRSAELMDSKRKEGDAKLMEFTIAATLGEEAP